MIVLSTMPSGKVIQAHGVSLDYKIPNGAVQVSYWPEEFNGECILALKRNPDTGKLHRYSYRTGELVYLDSWITEFNLGKQTPVEKIRSLVTAFPRNVSTVSM